MTPIENEKVPPAKKPPSLKKALGLLLGGALLIVAPMIYEYYSEPANFVKGEPQVITEVAPVVLHTAQGEIKLWAEIARTPQQQETGLMFRKFMAADKAMLFVPPQTMAQGSYFWMKNTLIPLDIIFVGPNLRVVYIGHNAKPLDESRVGTSQPVKTILEINGGLAAKWGLKVGDRLTSPAL